MKDNTILTEEEKKAFIKEYLNYRTDKDILEKAISKALKNGFLIGGREITIHYIYGDPLRDMTVEFKYFGKPFKYFGKPSFKSLHYRAVIFSHDFAKSFWPSEWQYHLQQMVLEENPIKYLEKFLD